MYLNLAINKIKRLLEKALLKRKQLVRNIKLEERVIERKVVVTLYELCDWGWFVEADTPVPGAEASYGRYGHSYGHFSTLELARSAELNLLNQAEQQGYKRSAESDKEDYKEEGIGVYYREHEDRLFQIKKKEVNKKSIVAGKYGKRKIDLTHINLTHVNFTPHW